ncbi:hypothetical protein EBS80_04845 [bacterium]|nr:hypothetical protein [bacterium]
MGIVRTGESELDEELKRWEKPYAFQPFPKMIYRGILRSDGRHDFEHTVVQHEREYRDFLAQGWVDSPADAKAGIERVEAQIAEAAAENAASAKKMSAKAQRELAAREAATHRHITE